MTVIEHWAAEYDSVQVLKKKKEHCEGAFQAILYYLMLINWSFQKKTTF